MEDIFDAYRTGRVPRDSAPVTLGNTATAIASQSCVVEYLAFANTDTNDIKVTVQSGTGKTFLPGITVAAGTMEEVSIPAGGLFFPSGLSAMAASAGKVDAWFRYRYF